MYPQLLPTEWLCTAWAKRGEYKRAEGVVSELVGARTRLDGGAPTTAFLVVENEPQMISDKCGLHRRLLLQRLHTEHPLSTCLFSLAFTVRHKYEFVAIRPGV